MWRTGAQKLPPTGGGSPMCSRDLVESTLRSRVRRRRNVTMVDDTTVHGLHIVDGRVSGVHATGRDV
jgi:hypothetical protein